ncbi:c-type cytochrome [Bacillus benzoevorans]|uniref:Cytochrome c551/c552 n=1 Tax=Bacillus benzoevorans TaxID=1456 RepID=A0A7X0LVD5_9BACI|nr:cytochrome c551/c552 [Bacillus benzoevorans]
MNKHIITFVVSLFLGFAIGALGFNLVGATDEKASETAADPGKTESASKEGADAAKTEQATATASGEDTIFQKKGCLSCHSISKLDLAGGATGPDLSQAYVNVEGKHGKPINEFLKQPTSAVMSGVIGGNPLTDEEINEVVEMLKQASEK